MSRGEIRVNLGWRLTEGCRVASQLWLDSVPVAVADSSFGSRSRVDSLERDQLIVAFFTSYL